MAWLPIARTPIQYEKTDGNPANGYYLKFYLAATTSPQNMATDETGVTQLAKCKLNERGFPISNPSDEASIFIPHVNSSFSSFRYVIYQNATDADANNLAAAIVNLSSVSQPVDIASYLVNTLQTVETFADLASTSATIGQQVSLLGHTQTGYGGGLFDVVSSATLSNDNGTIAINGGIAFVRAEKETISINDFGALPSSADNAVAINYAIAYVNANPGTVLTAVPGEYTTGPVNEITAEHTLRMPGVTFVNKANSLTAANAALFEISGPSIESTFAIDGNQVNYSAGNGTQMLLLSGSGHKLKGVRITNSPGRGAILNCNDSTFEDCNFDDNANLGFESSAAHGLTFIGGSTSRNGYGFQKTRANPADQTHDFAAFGHALRFRCYDITFIGFHADDNGRDGANINQGSYRIKYNGCTALRNDDGGFTIASDSTSPGTPGDGEACYDIEYVDCEGANNYTSGIAAYQTCHNLSVRGGFYYNNHRVAGKLTTASSYRNGIYVAGGSTGVNIDTKTYDERQTRVITANAAGVLSATGWIAGTKDYYPRAAIISGATRAFIGYVNISAEASGSVTVTAAAFNSAVVGTIAPGDYITQCVQHNGVFIDNNSQGYVKADAWGEKAGPADSGYKIFSGFYAGGQNVLVDGTKSATELLANPTFDVDILNWTYALPGGGSSVQVVTGVKSAGGLRLIAGTGAAQADATLIASGLDHTIGSFVELGVWCRADAQGDATLYLFWAPGAGPYSTTVTHPGGGWKYLKIGAYIPTGTTSVVCRLEAAIGKTTYWDNATFRAVELKTDNRDFAPASRSLPY